MKPKEIFNKACNEIATPFLDKGFKATKNGQCLKKISKDKDVTFEIYFSSSVYNTSCSIIIYPLISIYSKSLKKWMQEQTGNINEDGLVYHNHIGYISPVKNYKHWELAGLSFDVSVKSLTALLEQYALPIFELFENRDESVSFIEHYGCCFNQYTENSLSALPYVFLHGGRDKADNYFNAYLQSCKWRNKFMTAFEQLNNKQNIALGLNNKFAIFAFNNKLKIR